MHGRMGTGIKSRLCLITHSVNGFSLDRTHSVYGFLLDRTHSMY